MKTINKFGALLVMAISLVVPASAHDGFSEFLGNLFGFDPDGRLWTQEQREYERKRKEIQEANERIAQENVKIAEHNKEAAAHNKKVEPYNKAIKIMKKVAELLGGNHNHINDDYRQATDVFLKPEKEYFAQSDETIQRALVILERVDRLFRSEESRRKKLENYDKPNQERIRKNFLALLRTSGKYTDVARLILRVLSEGNYAKATKGRAREILNNNFNKLSGPALATALANLLSTGLNTHRGYEELCAQLGSLCGFTGVQGFVGTRIICSTHGVCGIVNDVVAEVSGAEQNMEKKHEWLVAGVDKVSTASDVLGLIRSKGMYIGTTYVGFDDIVDNVRSLDGGKQAAQKMFNVFAHKNAVKEIHDPKAGIFANKKIVLSDKTTITYQPKSKSGESIITIDNAPVWILPESVTLRFQSHVENVYDMSDTEKLKAERKKLYDGLSDEEKKKLDELIS